MGVGGERSTRENKVTEKKQSTGTCKKMPGVAKGQLGGVLARKLEWSNEKRKKKLAGMAEDIFFTNTQGWWKGRRVGGAKTGHDEQKERPGMSYLEHGSER